MEDYHDHDDDACDTSWAWSDSSADGAAAACATAAATNDGGTSSANHSSTERKGREMSLSEKLRQHELLEQQQQQMQQLHQKQLQHQMQHLQQQHYLQSRRERGGPMSDADHSVSRKLIPPIIQPTTDTTKYLSSSGDSVDSGGWSWPSNTSTTTSHYNTNTNTNATIHGNKRNQLGHQYLYNKYSKRGMFNNTVYQTFRGKGDNQLRTRIMSAMNCTKSPHQHDDDDTDEGDGRTYRDRNHTQQQPLNKMFGMLAKLGLMLLMMTGSVSRLAGRYHSKPKASSLSFKNMPSSSSSISMNDLYLRGQQTSYHAHGEIQQNSTHSTNLSQAILLPAHLSSHLSDIALPYYHSSSSIGTNNFTFRNKTVNNDTPYFWDVHFSGESVAEYIFSACHGLIQACEMGIRQPDFTENVSTNHFLFIHSNNFSLLLQIKIHPKLLYFLRSSETGDLPPRRSDICECRHHHYRGDTPCLPIRSYPKPSCRCHSQSSLSLHDISHFLTRLSRPDVCPFPPSSGQGR